MNNLEFETEYQNELKELELVIVDVYKSAPEIADFNVDKVLEGLIRTMKAEQCGKPGPKLRYKEIEAKLHDLLRGVVTMCIGQDEDRPWQKVRTDEEMINCLKRLRSSIRTWSSEGRRGYLTFISQFFADE